MRLSKGNILIDKLEPLLVALCPVFGHSESSHRHYPWPLIPFQWKPLPHSERLSSSCHYRPFHVWSHRQGEARWKAGSDSRMIFPLDFSPGPEVQISHPDIRSERKKVKKIEL